MILLGVSMPLKIQHIVAHTLHTSLLCAISPPGYNAIAHPCLVLDTPRLDSANKLLKCLKLYQISGPGWAMSAIQMIMMMSGLMAMTPSHYAVSLIVLTVTMMTIN